MGGIIGVTHLARNTSQVKELIVEVLSTAYPLSAHKVYQQIVNTFNISISYQRVHKILQEMVQYGVLKEVNREYVINTEWIDQLLELGERIKRNYLNQPSTIAPSTKSSNNSYAVLSLYHKALTEQLEIETSKLPFLNAVPLELDSLHLRQQSGREINAVYAISKNQYCLLLGDSGAGKTVALKMFALQLLREQQYLPIIILAANYEAEDLPTLIQQNIYALSKQEIEREFIVSLLHDGSLCVIIDGLNEAMGKTTANGTVYDRQELLIRRIGQYVRNEHRKNKFIVGCRTYNDPKDKLPIPALKLQPMDEKMIRNYLCQHSATNFLRLLQQKRLNSLCSNPFLLSTIVRWKDKTFANRNDIYKMLLDELMYHWESKNIRGNKEAMVSDAVMLLSELAYYMNSKGTSISYLQAHHILESSARILGIGKNYFNSLISYILHCNLLQKQQENCQFTHQSIQEYFASLALRKRELPSKKLLEFIQNKNWHETLIFYSNYAPEIMDQMLNEFELNKDHTLLFLAASCAAEINLMSGTTFDRLISQLLKVYSYPDDDFYLHWFNLNKTFQSWNNKAVSKHLINYFDQTGSPTSARMVNVLHHSQNARENAKGRGKLKEILYKNNADKHLLYSAIEIMALTKEASVMPRLVSFLTNKDPILRAQSAWALSVFDEEALHQYFKRNPLKHLQQLREKSFQQLVKLLDAKNPDFIRGHAIIELTRMNYRKALPYVLHCLKDDKPIIRYHAMYNVPRLSNEEAAILVSYVHKKEVPEELLSSLGVKTREVPKNGKFGI